MNKDGGMLTGVIKIANMEEKLPKCWIAKFTTFPEGG